MRSPMRISNNKCTERTLFIIEFISVIYLLAQYYLENAQF